MVISSMDLKEELIELNEELGEHTDVEEMEATNDEELEEGDRKLQDVYDALLENQGKYAKVAKSVVKKMKRVERDHKSTLLQLRYAKCEVKNLKEELFVRTYVKLVRTYVM